MRLEESFANRESSLLYKLKELQAAIDDRTGKGSAAEVIIEELLIRPFLPPGFLCGKGAVICSTEPDLQSPAIDRVIFDTRVSMPLVYDKSHSIFPAEVVAGMVEKIHLPSAEYSAGSDQSLKDLVGRLKSE